MNDIVIFEGDGHQVDGCLESETARGVLDYHAARQALDALANELRERGEASELFAANATTG